MIPTFTFQYVSINTEIRDLHDAVYIPLHSNMFLLILENTQVESRAIRTLHSNMFLLIPGSPYKIGNVILLYIPICFY